MDPGWGGQNFLRGAGPHSPPLAPALDFLRHNVLLLKLTIINSTRLQFASVVLRISAVFIKSALETA